MASNTRPFSGFEWMVATRYLRAKRQESFISVISGFSLVGHKATIPSPNPRSRGRERDRNGSDRTTLDP